MKKGKELNVGLCLKERYKVLCEAVKNKHAA